MTTFLNKVRRAITELDEASYDDEKTIKGLSEATRKTMEYYEKLRARNDFEKDAKDADLPLSKPE